MAREIGPKCKVCRRMGEKLFLKGEKCLSDKCVLGKRGEEDTKRGRKKLSPYSIQLKEKQKLKTIYGIPDTQLRIFFERASKTKGDTIVNLLSSLERRLDNVIYRLGFADSRASARQLIQHGHVAVNQRKIDIPSFLVSQNQTITVRNERASKLVKRVLANKDTTSAAWLSLDKDNLRGQVLNLPSSEDVKAMPFNAQLIVELFSK